MDQALELFLLCFWGGILGMIYVLTNALIRKKPRMTYVVWAFGGLFIFLVTAYFLFWLSNGKVGFYGFPVMLLGFFLFLHLLYPSASRSTRSFRHKVRRGFGGIGSFFRLLAKAFLLPFGFLVQVVEKLISWLLKPFKRKKEKKEENLYEEG